MGPVLCAKTYNPYTYCPLMFKHEDDFILAKVSMLAGEVMRVNGVVSWSSGGSSETSRIIDRYCGEITAYMNGRIHEIINAKKPDETMKRIKNIKQNLVTRKEWTKKDYDDFYFRDVSFLLSIIIN